MRVLGLLTMAVLPAAVGLLLGWGAHLVGESLDLERGEGALLSVEAPSEVPAGSRVTFHASADVSRPARVLVRLCAPQGTCLFERTEPIGTTTDSKWIATATVPAGTFRLEVFLQTETALGHRTTDSYTSLVSGL